MKPIHYLFIISIMALAACESEDQFSPVSSTGGQIMLSAGIVEGNQTVITRAARDNYQALTDNTAISLQVSGTWTGHDPVNIVKTTTAEVESSTDAANNLNLSPALYWDDYGTADSKNAETGRANGLTIYGAAVDGEENAPTVSDYTALSWNVGANQTDGWATKDLLISNNVKDNNTYKFDNRTDGMLLEFRHAMSKITVNLIAGEGFEDGKFINDPIVTLLDWAHTDGTVNITTGDVILGSAKGVTMYQASSDKKFVKKEALVLPGSAFVKGTNILKINADNNIYYVSSENIRKAINNVAHDTDDLTEAGKNYIFNVVVNKTGIKVTATIKDWTDLDSDEVHPLINVTTEVGGDVVAPKGENIFAFYRSEDIAKGYEKAASPKMEDDGSVDWSETTKLYWSSHNQHYHFRGIYPSATEVKPDIANQSQYIEVANGSYNAETFPSNLLIGMPELAEDEVMCDNPDHDHVNMNIYGICAREAAINLTFRYMMSQVEVVLTTSDEDRTDHVDLSNVKVELVNVYNTGHVLMSDRSVIVTGNSGTFTLPQIDVTKHQYLGVVVPQSLTGKTDSDSDNILIKLTVTNSDNTQDIYYADVEPILKKGSQDRVAPNGKWESGHHYVYNLKVTKTEIKSVASLQKWSLQEAEQEVWF